MSRDVPPALTIQADDVGMASSINDATRRAVRHGVIDAASVMVPCPHFDEIAGFCSDKWQVDWGLHATLTCEWVRNRWGPLSRGAEAAHLCDAEGHFHASVADFARTATPAAVRLEIAAQIAAAKCRGIRLSYLDCHMYAVYTRPDLMAAYIDAALAAGLPALIDAGVFGRSRLPTGLLAPHCIVIRRTVRYTRHEAPTPERWNEGYSRQISGVTGSHNQLLLHLGNDDAASRAMLGHHEPYGSGWRARDAGFAHSSELRHMLAALRIERRNWSSQGPNATACGQFADAGMEVPP